jgi:hypothetical protein
MANVLKIDNLRSELLERRIPMVTVWNRLEGRPRSVDFTRALRAEVRDALWMLTRQWQMGELHGDDAGSPVLAKVQLSQAALEGFQTRNAPASALDPAVPLETVVERRPLDIFRSGGLGAIDLRLAIGRRFVKSIPAPYRTVLAAQWPFVSPDPLEADDTDRVAHLEVWATLRAIAGRALDGYRLYEHLVAAPGNTPWGAVTVLDVDKPALVDAGARLVDFFNSIFETTDADVAWDPHHLEHRFAVPRRSRTATSASWPRSTPAAVSTGRRFRSTPRVPKDRANGAIRFASYRPTRVSTACPIRAGGRSRTGVRTSVTCTRTRPISRDSCTSNSRSPMETTGSRSPSSCRSA